jgi:twitching motility protein PilI
VNGDTAIDEVRSERKDRLRDFQDRLSERLRQASAAPHTARLGMQIGAQRWLVDLSEAGEIVPLPSAITPVPLTRDWLIGLANLRGTLFAVADLQRFAGDSPTPASKEARLLALSASLNVNAALIVTRMLGLHDPRGWTEDRERQHWAPWAGRCLIDGEGRDWHELSLSILAADERFLSASR